jgi:hypothetical protein
VNYLTIPNRMQRMPKGHVLAKRVTGSHSSDIATFHTDLNPKHGGSPERNAASYYAGADAIHLLRDAQTHLAQAALATGPEVLRWFAEDFAKECKRILRSITHIEEELAEVGRWSI